MIATWMIYCLLCALGLATAAAVAERALLGGRGPVRLVWVGAVALSLLIPAVALRFAPRAGAASAAPMVGHDVASGQLLDTTLTSSSPIVGPETTVPTTPDWRAILAPFDAPLVVAWVTLSLALAFNFFGGIVTLGRMRRRWEERSVLGVPVFVSERTGPAVVGAISPSIVMPEWVLDLEPPQLALMLRHEQEHRRARDGQLLTVAELALIVMPWNLALWWQIKRLRVAVELDCDARVLQDADARSYGALLLEVARPRRGPTLLGATAFAERATQLERRIRVLARHRVRTSRAARAVATCVALATVTVAWVAPRPPAPARITVPPAAAALVAPLVSPEPAPAPTVASTVVQAGDTSRDGEKALSDRPRTRIVGDTLITRAPNRARRTSAAPGRSTPAPNAPLPTAVRNVSPRVDSIFERLFNGIALTADQAATARAILAALALEQQHQDEVADLAFVVQRTTNQLLLAQRDSALRALLTNDDDRATFDARAAAPTGGARGRSAGPPPDASAGGGRGGRAGGGGRGGLPPEVALEVTRSLAGGDTARLYVLERRLGRVMIDATFHRLFDGITLTADQEASARDLITRTHEAMPQSFRRGVRLRIHPVSGLVTMQATSIAQLEALIATDAERALFRSRIASVPQ